MSSEHFPLEFRRVLCVLQVRSSSGYDWFLFQITHTSVLLMINQRHSTAFLIQTDGSNLSPTTDIRMRALYVCTATLKTPSMVGYSTLTMRVVATPVSLANADRKLLCFRKSIGTKFAVFQLRGGDSNGELLYQTAGTTEWSGTLSIPNMFRAVNESVAITIVHNGTNVTAYRNGMKVATQLKFAGLDYSFAEEMVVGNRDLTDKESWDGKLGDVLVRAGNYPPISALPAAERAALVDLYTACGGVNWQYKVGTDAVGGGAPWMVGDPCSEGWFGVECGKPDSGGASHVIKLFPNTRYSGNELQGYPGCSLSSSIGALTELEHLYMSNDKTPSHLNGPIPAALGSLRNLKCIYFSHTGVEGEIPVELENLVNLQVFLMRCNKLVGPLIDFTKLPKLLNVWFDTNNLTGTLSGLGGLTNLTFLQASNTALTGPVPASLCNIKCDAAGSDVTCDPSLPKGCCEVSSCGSGKPAPPPPPPSMGECFPQ